MFKKSSFLTLLVMLLISMVLVACGGDDAEETPAPTEPGDDQEQVAEGDAPEKPESLTIWVNDNEGQLAATNQIIENYTEETGINIEVVPMNFDDQVDNLSLDGPAGQGPDVFMNPHDRTGGITLQGLAAELNIPEEVANTYFQNAYESFQIDGEQYGVPIKVETYALYYNKEHLEEVPETMAELMEFAKDFTQGDQYGFLANPGDLYFMKPFLTGPGGYIFGGEAGALDASDIGLNNDGAVEGGQLIQSWVTDGLMPADMNLDNAAAIFEDGRAATILNGPWALNGFRDALGDNLGVAPLPKFDNGEVPDTFSGNHGWFVSAFSDNTYWATDFIIYLTNEASQQIWFEVAGEIPANQSVAESDLVANDEHIAGFVEQLAFAEPMPNIPEMSQVWGPMNDSLQLILQGEDVQEILDEAVDQIHEEIALQQ
ncbi:extracellular solute-binding protein [Alkalihalobacillus sp. LMS39]|uniref:sugar ABC transporter substrate-binding protein n=1 Tax=Alkalihalobacillus sp. LMS39 TaxID=2924032 RepID=UPI001FB1C331|nr:extracellular solute-binding protein [Alkalihalobacillus sp. LMS39]UOE95376.1 extracellular solute-binding protein [Alkalihalobacillus sp. LMS39]